MSEYSIFGWVIFSIAMFVAIHLTPKQTDFRAIVSLETIYRGHLIKCQQPSCWQRKSHLFEASFYDKAISYSDHFFHKWNMPYLDNNNELIAHPDISVFGEAFTWILIIMKIPRNSHNQSFDCTVNFNVFFSHFLKSIPFRMFKKTLMIRI